MWRKISFLVGVSVFVSFSTTLFATDRLVPSQYATIQAAIDASVNGDTVIIADGTYTGTGNYNIDFAGKAITVCSENGPENCIIDCQNTEGRRGFYFHTGETATSAISGLTIKRGKITGIPGIGAGIYCNASSPTIEDCVITGNNSRGSDDSTPNSSTPAGTATGGGISCLTSSHPTIINCVISNNTATGGNGYVAYSMMDDGSEGGLAKGGGIYGDSTSTPTVIDCNITSNIATGGHGGADYLEVGGENQWNGLNGGSADGGGIACSAATIQNCILTANKAKGGLWGGTPAHDGQAYGGAISTGTSANISNCTMVNNIAESAYSAYGGGIKGAAATAIINCILWANGDDLYGCSATYSCIEDGDAGAGNIAADPCFVPGLQGNYYLSQTAAGQTTNSPCVDAGSDTAANLQMNEFTTMTEGAKDKGIVDMGYHYPVMIGTSDISKNWHVDFTDYAALAVDWLQCSGANWLWGDIDNDDCVDTNDLELLSESWLNCYVTSATVPSPADNAAAVARDPVLSWTAGIGAVHHDVYFGTSLTDVNNADTSSPFYQGRQALTSWDSNSIYPNGLLLDNTYYWRIDEVGPACIEKGSVWQFTVVAGVAFNPAPPDQGLGTDVNAILQWTPGTYAVSHNVYFGTSFNDVNASTTPLYTTDVNNYDPGTLYLETTYYWRIDEYDGFTTHKGNVWSFTTRSSGFDPHLVGWWKLDETEGTAAYDSSGYYNDGTFYSSPLWTTGQIDGALAFDGVDDYINCGNDTILNITGSISISAWVKFNSLPYNQTILIKNHIRPNYAFQTGSGANCDELEFYLADSSMLSCYTTSSANMVPGTWYHVAMTLTFGTGSSMKCYLNGGLLIGSWGGTYADLRPYISTDPVRIGGKPYGRTINGTIDDVRIYNRILTADQIKEICHEGLAGKAFNPFPSYSAINVDTNVDFNWQLSSDMTSHEIYLGTNFIDVNNGTIPLETTDVNTYDPGFLNYGTTYYWRVDEFDGLNTYKGDVWNFTTMSGKASNPSPTNGATSVDSRPTLSWTAAPYATEHDVYIGTSFSEVESSLTPVATTSAASYSPGTLNYATTYYWRIDEFDGNVSIKGDVWSFTTWPQFDPNLNLISFWKFDETSGTTAYDSASSNNGNFVSTPVWTTGQINGGLAFDSVDDYLNCGSASNLNIGSNITISAWVKFNSLSGNQTILAKRGASTDTTATYAVRSAGSQFDFYFKSDSSYWNVYRATANMVTGTWYHISVTHTFTQGSSIKCYINGNLCTGSWVSKPDTSNYPTQYNTRPLTIGSLTDAERMNGTIDEIRLYNRILSAADVKQLYKSGLP